MPGLPHEQRGQGGESFDSICSKASMDWGWAAPRMVKDLVTICLALNGEPAGTVSFTCVPT